MRLQCSPRVPLRETSIKMLSGGQRAARGDGSAVAALATVVGFLVLHKTPGCQAQAPDTLLGLGVRPLQGKLISYSSSKNMTCGRSSGRAEERTAL